MTAEMAWQQAQALDELPTGDISHIPGRRGWPIVGDAFTFFNNPLPYMRRCMAEYGPVFRNRMGPMETVNIIHPDAQQLLTLDPDQLFSAGRGYGTSLGEFFPDGLLLRDFSDHRMHRRIMQTSFKNAQLDAYMPEIHRVMRRHVKSWRDQGQIKFVPAIKAALLEVGSRVFLGMELGEASDKINRSFIAMAEGSSTPLRFEIPGTVYYQGKRGYEYTTEYFRKQIPIKRASDGNDMFTLFSKETDKEGNYFSDDDLVHHVNFLLFAAHDTTTSTLSSLFYELTQRPDWMETCRAEVSALSQDQLCYADLDKLEQISYCFKETLRMYPPVAGFARRNMREFEIMGYRIPENSTVSVSVVTSHRLEEFYRDPDEFDPTRFAPGREEHKAHPFAWFPFGGGAHKCIGVHFAEMLVKVALFEMLREYDFSATTAPSRVRFVPFPKPVNDLPMAVSLH